MRYRESDSFVVPKKEGNSAGRKGGYTWERGVRKHRPFTAAGNRWQRNCTALKDLFVIAVFMEETGLLDINGRLALH